MKLKCCQILFFHKQSSLCKCSVSTTLLCFYLLNKICHRWNGTLTHTVLPETSQSFLHNGRHFYTKNQVQKSQKKSYFLLLLFYTISRRSNLSFLSSLPGGYLLAHFNSMFLLWVSWCCFRLPRFMITISPWHRTQISLLFTTTNGNSTFYFCIKTWCWSAIFLHHSASFTTS